jgi:hypothetical protein
MLMLGFDQKTEVVLMNLTSESSVTHQVLVPLFLDSFQQNIFYFLGHRDHVCVVNKILNLTSVASSQFFRRYHRSRENSLCKI